ncbi:MAG: holo-ACP synthase [Gammaproteobacteria bacterium]
MIAGIGCDLVDLRRLQKFLARYPQRLPQRLLAEKERAEFTARNFAAEYLAGRIAAKEALAKALRQGMRAPLGWRRVSVLNESGGAPSFLFDPQIAEYLRARNIAACHLSLTHHGDYAAAFVVAEFAAAATS